VFDSKIAQDTLPVLTIINFEQSVFVGEYATGKSGLAPIDVKAGGVKIGIHHVGGRCLCSAGNGEEGRERSNSGSAVAASKHRANQRTRASLGLRVS